MLASRGMRLATGTHGGCESADPVSASRYCGRLKVSTMAWGIDLLVSFFAHQHKAALLLMLLLNKENRGSVVKALDLRPANVGSRPAVNNWRQQGHPAIAPANYKKSRTLRVATSELL